MVEGLFFRMTSIEFATTGLRQSIKRGSNFEVCFLSFTVNQNIIFQGTQSRPKNNNLLVESLKQWK